MCVCVGGILKAKETETQPEGYTDMCVCVWRWWKETETEKDIQT